MTMSDQAHHHIAGEPCRGDCDIMYESHYHLTGVWLTEGREVTVQREHHALLMVAETCEDHAEGIDPENDPVGARDYLEALAEEARSGRGDLAWSLRHRGQLTLHVDDHQTPAGLYVTVQRCEGACAMED